MPDPSVVGGSQLGVEFALFARLALAALLGGIVGLEREISGKPAGLRTNLLICVGAALLTELSIGVATRANLQNAMLGVEFRADPARIAAQIVSGIGFLGAGTILQARGHVVGLTTAATIWVVAAIGMAVGAEAYLVATGATALVVLSLVALSRLELLAERRWGSHRYVIVMEPGIEVVESVEQAFIEGGLRVVTHSVDKADERFEVMYDLRGPVRDHERLIRSLVARPDVHRVSRLLS
jgi:putative Mg2+ transporter-C (MgtC) family protein